MEHIRKFKAALDIAKAEDETNNRVRIAIQFPHPDKIRITAQRGTAQTAITARPGWRPDLVETNGEHRAIDAETAKETVRGWDGTGTLSLDVPGYGIRAQVNPKIETRPENMDEGDKRETMESAKRILQGILGAIHETGTLEC